MNCAVCYRVMGTDLKTIKLTCSCTSCIDCLTAWTIEQINALEFQSKQEVPCMEGFCKKPFKVEQILDQFPQAYQQRINDALFNVYLRKAQDIRQCPTDSCAYAGIIDLNSTCDGNLKCAICNTEWKEKALYTPSSQGFESKIKFLLDAEEMSCLAWEEFFTKKCPRCNASIQKNGGCSHMTCKGCGMEFCWYCTQDNYNHDNKICWLNLAVKLVLFLYFIMQIIYLSGICEEIVDLGLKVFNGVLEAFFLDFFLYILCIISPHDIIGRFYMPENKIRLLISLVIFCFFLLVVALLDAVTSILRIFLFQAAVVGLGLVYVDYFGKWINYVF